MDLIMIEEKLNKDCLDNIYSFIKPSKEKQTAINFKLFLEEQVNKWYCNKVQNLKIGSYYINKKVLYCGARRDYFKVINITKCFITINNYTYNFELKKYETDLINKKIKLKEIEKGKNKGTYQLNSNKNYFFNAVFNELIEYDKPPEFIKHIGLKTLTQYNHIKLENYNYSYFYYSNMDFKLKYNNDYECNESKLEKDEEINWILN
jgi:hypothetical protein|tara:strand:+ start:89 stop:706 length:618 start_codon:yes stop_codon:yes gene_type:complete